MSDTEAAKVAGGVAETRPGIRPAEPGVVPPGLMRAEDAELVRQLGERAQAGGLRLSGEGGLLARLAKIVIEGALEGERDARLGYGRHDPAGRDGGNSRNGYRAKTVLTGAGPVPAGVPRDRDASFSPQIAARRQRRLSGVYGVEVSRDLIGTITGRVPEGLAGWQNRPLDRVYPVIFTGVINVKIRGGSVASRPACVALAVTAGGERDVPGLRAGEHGGGEGARYWLRVLTEIKNRGVADVCMLACDGLKGLPGAIAATWPQAITQTCVVRLLRNSFKYASRRDWAAIAKALKPV